MHLLGCNRTYQNNFFGLHNHQVGSGGHSTVEILLGQAVLQISRFIGAPGPNESHVAVQRGHKNHFLPVQHAGIRSLGDGGAHSGRGVKAPQTCPASPQRLSQAALGKQLHFQIAV